MILQGIQADRHDLQGGTITEDSAGPLAKTWPEPMQTEQPEGRSQDERNGTVLKAFFTLVQNRCPESNTPGVTSTPLKNRLSFEYKNFMTTFKDDNERAENHEEALEDPNLDEYHSTKGREEDEVHKSKLLRLERIHEPTTWLILPCLTGKVR